MGVDSPDISVKGTPRSHFGNRLRHSHTFEISANVSYYDVTGRAVLRSPKGRNTSRNGLVKLVGAVSLLKFASLFRNLFCSKLWYSLSLALILHIFNLSQSLHSFPSIWKTSSIIVIHKMEKLLDSPASFRPISLTSCVSKLFECIVLPRLLFFVESYSILSPPPGRFPPWTVYFKSNSVPL